MRNAKRQRNNRVEKLMKSRNCNQFVKRSNTGNNILTVNLAMQITGDKRKNVEEY